ncbi:MAG TPA: glucose-6-phosphate dehydrogenase assembly protein OpcA, partial [Acidobacteriota bacterium]|nr:glucose-6-phosphate dehydrogenase assembly protein OpcA [Acidobacteriota bacterium]
MSDASVAQIERDLKEQWTQMAESTQKEGQLAVMRTCVMNLIAYTRDPESSAEASRQLSEVASHHPARTIIVSTNSEAPEPMLDAVVSAFCSIFGGGRKQVCCEQILLRAQGDRLNQIPSLIRPLLIPDLPTVLWWRDQIPFEDSLFDDFLNTADRVILDSARLPKPAEQLAQIAALVQKERQWTAFSDLNWARLNPWRLSMARL